MSLYDDVSADFSFDKNECVKNPGKFEGEHISTVYYWMLSLEGCCDEEIDDGFYVHSVFFKSTEHPDTPSAVRIDGFCKIVYENDLGFVFGTELETEKEYREFVDYAEKQAEKHIGETA